MNPLGAFAGEAGAAIGRQIAAQVWRPGDPLGISPELELPMMWQRSAEARSWRPIAKGGGFLVGLGVGAAAVAMIVGAARK